MTVPDWQYLHSGLGHGVTVSAHKKMLTSDDLMLESQQICNPGPLLSNCAWPPL